MKLRKIEVVSAKELLSYDTKINSNVLGYINNTPGITIWTDSLDNPNGIIINKDYFKLVCSKDEKFSYNLYKKYKNYKSHIGFSGVSQLVAKPFYDNMDVVWSNPCYLFTFNDKKIEVKTDKNVRQLRIEDAKKVNEFYTYKSANSLKYIKDCITKRPALGYEINGKLVSWVLVHSDESMGIMYTVDEYRCMGIAKILTSNLIKMQLSRGQLPYVHIVKTNENSIKLAKSQGFELYDTVEWFGIVGSNIK